MFRQEQVNKLQNRIKAMSDFYSKECTKPRLRPTSPTKMTTLGLARIKSKYKLGEQSQIVRSEYGILDNKSPRFSSKIIGK